MRWFERSIDIALLSFLLLTLSFSTVRLEKLHDRVHVLAASHGFDFASWTLNAAWVKLSQSAIRAPLYFPRFDQHQIVVDYVESVRSIETTRDQLNKIYADPSIEDPTQASADLRQQLDEYTARQNALAPMAESVLQEQVTEILNELELTNGGQPFPWVLYHVTPLPQNLIISSRSKIEQQTSYQLAQLTVEQASSLESAVDEKLGVSSLVVDIGGLATYPTMIMRTTALNWISSTIAHEWIHLYFGQRPLGINYETSPEVRTMNETASSIAGDEIGRIVMQRYYPELTQAPAALELVSRLIAGGEPQDPPFDFRAAMHETRITADALLAEGKIDEAEAYMEERRQIFWDHGYTIRKLNQAYFAFYGAYADVPGGPAGEDPVGPAVRALRDQSPSLRAFLERIAQMSTFAELQQATSTSAGY